MSLSLSLSPNLGFGASVGVGDRLSRRLLSSRGDEERSGAGTGIGTGTGTGTHVQLRCWARAGLGLGFDEQIGPLFLPAPCRLCVKSSRLDTAGVIPWPGTWVRSAGC